MGCKCHMEDALLFLLPRCSLPPLWQGKSPCGMV